MNPLLKKTRNSAIDFLLQGSLYESLYAKIEEVLSAEEASVFCRIERRQKECIWYGEDGIEYRPLSQLGEAEKFALSDLLAERKAAIMPKLKADRVLATHAEHLFKVPSEADIYQVRRPDGSMDVAISRWATRLAMATTEADPIIKLINIPKPDHFSVTVSIQYSDGTSFIKEPFFFSYQDNSLKQFKTDENGCFQVGTLKQGRTFGIRQFKEGEEQIFTVDSEQLIYPVIFPRYISVDVLVINQEDTPIPNQAIHFIKGEDTQIFHTDEAGIFTVESILLDNAPIELSTPDGSISQTYQLTFESEQLTFQLTEKMYGEVSLLVKDQHGEPYSGYPVTVQAEGEDNNYISQADGKIDLGQIEVGTPLQIVDGKDQNHRLSHKVEKGPQELIMEVERPVIPPVKVQLLNHKRKPIPGIPLALTMGENRYDQKTDAEGLVSLSKDLFSDGEKVKVGIHLPNKKGKEKVISKSFKYDAGISQYTIRLRKPNWWWLLLFLLPLLLIRCEKEVYVQVLEDGTNAPVAGSVVHFNYNKAFIYDEGRFFTNDADPRRDTTDGNGVAKFSSLEYSVYSLIFKSKSRAITYASSNCFASDTLTRQYHFIRSQDTLNLKVYPILSPMDFQVVDAEDGEPLPDASVIIEASYLDRVYKDSAITDPNGRVVFNNIPKCGLVNFARATAEGYFSNELLGVLPKATGKIELYPFKKYQVCVFNHNSARDELFDLYINNIKIGEIKHDSDKNEKTCFDFRINILEEYIIELKFLSDGDKGKANTGSTLIINPGGINKQYGGDNDSYKFRFIPGQNSLQIEK